MSGRRKGIPSYCLHRPSGKAVVRIDGRDHYLGPYDSPESRSEYDRVIAEWLARGRQPEFPEAESRVNSLSVNEVLLKFIDYAERYYRDGDQVSKEVVNYKHALRVVKQLYGNTSADKFGPLALKAIRQHMIDVQDLCRKEINKRLGRIKRVFKWAVSEELILSSVFEGLRSVEGLRVGRTTARDNEPVKPVEDFVVESTLRFLSPQVRAMIQIQRLTGMRPGEVTIMRAVRHRLHRRGLGVSAHKAQDIAPGGPQGSSPRPPITSAAPAISQPRTGRLPLLSA